MQLQGMLALITGGGHGIGRGILDRFLEEGATVVVAQRRPLPADLERHPAVQSLQADLTDAAAIPRIVDEAAERLGGLDVLVNNAGMMFERSPHELTVAEWDRMMALNLRAPMFLAQAAIPHLARRGGGSIVSIGSIEGIGTNPGHAAYSASKAGLHGLTRALAVDLGAEGIRVNAIAPGWIRTDLAQDYLAGFADPAAAVGEIEVLHPLGRLGAPEDIGDAAVFLAGPQSRFVTGQTMVVDGGRTTRLPMPQR